MSSTTATTTHTKILHGVTTNFTDSLVLILPSFLLTDPRAKRTTIEDVYNLLSVGFMKGTSGFLKAGGGEQKGGGMINREVRVGFTHVSILIKITFS